MARIHINQSKIVKSFPSYSNSKLVPKGIVIHDTAGHSSAASEADRLQSSSQYNNGIAHFYIDDKECYQLVYANKKAWHCGDGSDQPGNGTMLGIEVCKSLPSGGFTSNTQKETYQKALDRAYQLAADLCEEWGINPNNIHQHREFSSTSCPYAQKVLYGDYEKALNEAKNKVNYYFDGGSYYENDSQNNDNKGDGYMNGKVYSTIAGNKLCDINLFGIINGKRTAAFAANKGEEYYVYGLNNGNYLLMANTQFKDDKNGNIIYGLPELEKNDFDNLTYNANIELGK